MNCTCLTSFYVIHIVALCSVFWREIPMIRFKCDDNDHFVLGVHISSLHL